MTVDIQTELMFQGKVNTLSLSLKPSPVLLIFNFS